MSLMNEDEIARAVTHGLHQYDADRRAAERRWARKTALTLFVVALVFGLLILASFGKL